MGTCWLTGSWAADSWVVGSWADATSTPEIIMVGGYRYPVIPVEDTEEEELVILLSALLLR